MSGRVMDAVPVVASMVIWVWLVMTEPKSKTEDRLPLPVRVISPVLPSVS